MKPRYEKRFYPGYGYCIDVSNYNITEEIILKIELNWGKALNKFQINLENMIKIHINITQNKIVIVNL